MKTLVTIVKQQALTEAQKEEMWHVYKHYYHYSKIYFMERINQNTHFSLYLNNGKIGGFTGLRINTFKVGNRAQFLIYFGQTVISYQLRGQSLIPTTCFKLIVKYWKELLNSLAWFWYDALSYKAYLVSAKTAAEYYPTYKCPIPNQVKILMDKVGQYYYAENYQPDSGIVKKAINYLKDATVKIYESDLKDADIAFYARANPGHEQGHGLLTFSPINWENILMIAKRNLHRHIYFSKNKWNIFTAKRTSNFS
ncbi:MAG: hypothetical protein R2825_10440 [Saprospiraceae bacterium]